ncbi:hypothetical protein [Marinivivus vitaminiproducens]|uniref:hypothetical protein n=1 Tax=Marinivivus vitaminiproducens TaxID=3035935 RepID=UPI0027A57C81|nr:hypothetical protein P4R82_22550 [Geminicoccaceae bacterium SCSIO 64248]
MSEQSAEWLTPRKTIVARAALNWSTEDLARRAGLEENRIWRFEHGYPIRRKARQALQEVLEYANVRFVTVDGQPHAYVPR